MSSCPIWMVFDHFEPLYELDNAAHTIVFVRQLLPKAFLNFEETLEDGISFMNYSSNFKQRRIEGDSTFEKVECYKIGHARCLSALCGAYFYILNHLNDEIKTTTDKKVCS